MWTKEHGALHCTSHLHPLCKQLNLSENGCRWAPATVKEGEGTPPQTRRGVMGRAVAGTVHHQELAHMLHQCRQGAMEQQMVEAMEVGSAVLH